MKVIISPAKKMNIKDELLSSDQAPVFADDCALLYQCLNKLDAQQLKTLWGCNERITRLNIERLQQMQKQLAVTPALLAYEGIQYQHIAPTVFSHVQWQYVQQHLRILSGFYGLLRPQDRVVPYRLEMQAKLTVGSANNLYEFWGDKLYRELFKAAEPVINLASKEYSKTIEPYLQKTDCYITCHFTELEQGKSRVKATLAKIARGEMVRWMAEHQIRDPQVIKQFDVGGYRYQAERSTAVQWFFEKPKDWH